MRKFLLACALLLAAIHSLRAQWPRQIELSRQMTLHKLAHPANVLFVHFDKNIYTNNETVWFTGYLLNVSSEELNKHILMSVALVRDIDSVVIKQSKFLMEAGFAFGTMLLPDSMLTGSYHFVATTNRVRLGIPDAMFTQPVTIKTNIDPPFQAGISLYKAGEDGKVPNTVRINVTDKDDHPLKKPVIISYKYGSLAQTAKADAAGQLELTIPEQPGIKDPNIYARIRSGNDSTFINLTLPVTKKRATVSFYPEGGYMIESLPSHIACEVKDQRGAVVATSAVLYRDGIVMDTFATNSYGIGKFMLNPLPGVKYSMRLLHDGFVDSAYTLPDALQNGVAIYMADAAVKDTLQVRFLTTRLQKVAIRIHDFRDTYFYTEFDLDIPNKTIRIPLNMLKGLKTFTVSDSLGRPMAERMFFAKYDPVAHFTATTGKQIYGRREKVTLHLRLNNMDSLGMASIACVQDNRISSRQYTDIESYFYLKNELNALPLMDGRGVDNKEYVEDIMMVKGWRRYNWLSVVHATEKEALQPYDTMDVRIRVTRFGKPVKKPVEIGLVSSRGIITQHTDAGGIASLNDENLIAAPFNKIHVLVLDKRKEDCNIETDDPYVWLNNEYARVLPDDYAEVPTSVKNNRELALKGNEKIRQLKEVVIRAKDDNSFFFRGNECGDYVCPYKILNCQNHRSTPGNVAPVPGETYTDGFTRMQVVYKSCKDQDRDRFIIGVEGIYTRKDFYVDSYAEPLEPAFISTLYWNHGILLQKEGQTIEFYTGDIAGKFRVVVQGVTNNDVSATTCTFEVKGAP